MTISIISALAENRVIGNKNTLPWHLPADFKYFKEKTLNKTIVLGLNTFKSIGEKPLPHRKHIILHTDPNYKVPENCFLATSIDQALELSRSLCDTASRIDKSEIYQSGQKKSEDCELMVCGGASVYKQFLPLADRLYLTYIHHSFEGDTFFPEIDMNQWKEVSRQDHQPDDLPAPAGANAGGQAGKNKYAYSFVVLEKLQA